MHFMSNLLSFLVTGAGCFCKEAIGFNQVKSGWTYLCKNTEWQRITGSFACEYCLTRIRAFFHSYVLWLSVFLRMICKCFAGVWSACEYGIRRGWRNYNNGRNRWRNLWKSIPYYKKKHTNAICLGRRCYAGITAFASNRLKLMTYKSR